MSLDRLDDKALFTGARRLFYTKDGDLDFGWVILIVCVLFGLVAFVLESIGLWDISTEAWVWFGSFTTMSFIAGVAISRARLIAKKDE